MNTVSTAQHRVSISTIVVEMKTNWLGWSLLVNIDGADAKGSSNGTSMLTTGATKTCQNMTRSVISSSLWTSMKTIISNNNKDKLTAYIIANQLVHA